MKGCSLILLICLLPSTVLSKEVTETFFESKTTLFNLNGVMIAQINARTVQRNLTSDLRELSVFTFKELSKKHSTYFNGSLQLNNKTVFFKSAYLFSGKIVMQHASTTDGSLRVNAKELEYQINSKGFLAKDYFAIDSESKRVYKYSNYRFKLF